MAAFAEWQPRYAEHGIATFPVTIATGVKKPAVANYLKIGLRASNQFALRFPDNDAFGFACGSKSNITVLDVDTPDERVLADALDRHGATPLIVRSGSGNHQAWYRNNGEGRRVRPDPALPIDILGNGYVVAPPSQGSRGRYTIVQGSLDDLERLPKMRAVLATPTPKRAGESLGNLSGSDLHAVDVPKRVVGLKEGDGRNPALWTHCMKMARGCHAIEELMDKAMEYNRELFAELLPADEVLKVVASAWGYECEGKNWFGHGARVVVQHAIVDDLAADEPVAFSLLSILQRHHWNRDFVLSAAFAEKLGWDIRAFRKARDVLAKRGLIECIHKGGRGPGDPPLYRFPKGGENVPQ